MNRLFVPSLGPTDWRRLLADPETQWERYKSAFEMAVCWEAARDQPQGLPLEVVEALDVAPELRGAELLLGVPEHKVPFEGGGHPSQNDLWALLRVRQEIVSLTVEAKAGEKLDELVKDWLPKDGERSRKPQRLAALKAWLGLDEADVSGIRYQLLHRTASALKQAQRFRADIAVMLVQSFNRQADEQSWRDFITFADLMGIAVEEGMVARSTRKTSNPLFIGWVTSMPADLGRLSAAV